MNEAPKPADRGLARERTNLAWTRSGLAVAVCIATLLRHLWPLQHADQAIAIGLIAATAIVWGVAGLTLTGRRGSGDRPILIRAKTFPLITAATVLLAAAGSVLAFFVPS